MLPTVENIQQYLLGPLVTQWFSRFKAAEKSKERFTLMAKLCRQFLGSSAKTMWEDSFRREFYPGIAEPQFMVSLNKAFELVAIIGPSLYWQNPTREVRSTDLPDQTKLAMMMGVQDQDMLEQIQQMQQADTERREIRNSLASAVLDHLEQNHPGGTKVDLEMIIQDGLVTGRGCGWTETYLDRVTGEPSVGTFYDTVDNLGLDPDAKDPALRDVTWMYRKHVEPIWVVERRFGYPPGYLAGRGTHISAEYQATGQVQMNRGVEMYQDQIEWYEVWSSAGIGARVTGVNAKLGQALDHLTGDHCYLCMTRNLAHPLNLPPSLVLGGMEEDILEALKWRTSKYGQIFELWKDRRWPVEVMDFYPVTGSCWPMAVLGPGIGSLLAMNILLVSYLTMSWDRRRDIIAVLGAYAEDLENAIRGENNPAIIKINSASNMSITDIVGFVNRPDIGGNLLEWIQYLDGQFQMATGLDDIHYGISQKQARVSSDVAARTSAANVRPDKMATDVHRFVVACGTKELWLAAGYVKGQRLVPLLGSWGAMAWEMLFSQLPFEELIREVEVWIEATDLRRPNRDKDISDLGVLAPFYLPLVQVYAQLTGDEKPLNAFVHRYAAAMQLRNPEDLYFGPWSPAGPDPAMMQQQQEFQKIEAEKKLAETREIDAKTAARLVDAQYKQQGAAGPAMQKLKWTDIFNRQKMLFDSDMHAQKMLHLEEAAEAKPEPQKVQR